jgi:hypothetical protein
MSDDSQNPRLAVKLWLDEYDSERGTALSIFNVQEFELRESMFLKLPFGQLTYSDDGTSKNSNRFYNGRLLYIGFEYASSSDNPSAKNISLGRYRILGAKIQTSSSGMTNYVVTFVYDALGLVNSVPRFPRSSADYPCLSTDVMRSVCSDIGLRFSTNVDTSDQMAWFNPSMTAEKFLRFVIDHSVIDKRDFGMFWVSKNGEARFNGIRAILESGIPFYFDNDVNKSLQDSTKHVIFSDVFSVDSQKMSEDELLSKYKDKMYILMSEDQRNSDGWVSDFYGNSSEISVYDPIGRSLLLEYDDLKIDWAHISHKITVKTIQSGMPSTDVTDREIVRENKFNGYASVEFTHADWDFAPTYNSNMRSVFFDNRHTILINTGKQLNCFLDQEIRIGDVLEIDFSSPDRQSVIDNGKHIVHSIDWCFKKGSDLVLFVRVASDSVHPNED